MYRMHVSGVWSARLPSRLLGDHVQRLCRIGSPKDRQVSELQQFRRIQESSKDCYEVHAEDNAQVLSRRMQDAWTGPVRRLRIAWVQKERGGLSELLPTGRQRCVYPGRLSLQRSALVGLPGCRNVLQILPLDVSSLESIAPWRLWLQVKARIMLAL